MDFKPRNLKISGKGMLQLISNGAHSAQRTLSQMREPLDDFERAIQHDVRTAVKALEGAQRRLESHLGVPS